MTRGLHQHEPGGDDSDCIGTLFAFVIVCGAVIIMRRANPTANRPFRVPLVPLIPILGILTCLLLMFSLPVENRT
jgi:APA family basic amino acid/polyamine antiporter